MRYGHPSPNPRGPLMVWVALLMYFLMASHTAQANSYASGPPLTKFPAPEEVFAFGSNPGESRVLPEAGFLRFLREGAIESDPQAITNVFDGSWCTGYFFTNDGTPYRWALWSRHLLSIGTGDRGCLIRLQNSEVQSVPSSRDRDILMLLSKPPSEKDLYAFVTDLLPSTGLAFPLSDKNLRHFLRAGKVAELTKQSDLYRIADGQKITFSPQGRERLEKYMPPLEGEYSIGNHDIHCQGALVTKDRCLFFWKLLGDTALEVTSPAGEKCILLLPETSPIEAPSF